jgi:hypothetical protein
VTAIQLQTGRGRMEVNPAAIGPGGITENGLVCRPEARKILSRAAIWLALPSALPAEAVALPGCPDIQASV